MVTFKKRADAYVLRIKRQGRERVIRLPLQTPKRELEKQQAEINHKLLQGWNPFEGEPEMPQESRKVLGTAIRLYLDSLLRKSEGTRYFYRTPLKSLESYFTAQADITVLTQADLDRWLLWTGVSDATKETYSIVVAQMFKFHGLTFYKTYHERGNGRVERLKYFTLEELDAICARELASGRRFSQSVVDVWRITFFMGFRSSGIATILKRDVSESYIRVLEKGSKVRTVPVIPAVADAVKRLMARPGDLLCSGLSRGMLYDRLKEHVKALFTEDRWGLTFHSLRHGCATYWLEKGLAITDIAAVLGHESVTTTQIYAKVLPVSLAERMKALV